MTYGDTKLREVLTAIPQGAHDGWNRYDTDNEHVLHLWADGESWDIRVPKQRPSVRPAGLVHMHPFIDRLRVVVVAGALTCVFGGWLIVALAILAGGQS